MHTKLAYKCNADTFYDCCCFVSHLLPFLPHHDGCYFRRCHIIVDSIILHWFFGSIKLRFTCVRLLIFELLIALFALLLCCWCSCYMGSSSCNPYIFTFCATNLCKYLCISLSHSLCLFFHHLDVSIRCSMYMKYVRCEHWTSFLSSSNYLF